MVTGKKRYDLKSVKNDVKSFFQDDSHWAYQFGSKATSCSKDSLFYKKQIQVILEDSYPHDVTGKAVNELIEDEFLKEESRTFGKMKNVPIIFVCRKSRRYISNEVKERIRIIERYSDEELNEGCGKYAESLFNHIFEKHNFKIIDRNTNTYRGKKWRKSNKDFDFLIEKDGCAYGLEVKNTFDYMPQDEFEEKLEMCKFFGILPLFPVRFASPQQHKLMQSVGGLALVFKTRIFPPGNQNLVTDIWNNFRLPVNVWYEISKPVESIFLSYHSRNKNR